MRHSLSVHIVSAQYVVSTTPNAWAEVARGELSPEEAAARVESQEPVELIESSKELFAPLTAEQREAHIRELLGEPATTPSSRWRRWWLIPMVSVAAATALVITLRGSLDPAFVGNYEADFVGELASKRCAGDDPPTVYAVGQLLILRLVPKHAIEGPVEVAVFGRTDNEPMQRLELDVRVSDEGVIELSGRVGARDLRPGRWTLGVVVGRVGHVPHGWDQIVVSEPSETLGYEVVQTSMQVVADPSEAKG